MRKSGKMVRQSDITRYVYSCLMHNPSDEPQPLGELELARKFGTTRLTIQRALATFERDGRLIRIPGRRGLFMNPAVAKAMGDYYFFGVMTAERRNRFLDSGTQAVISGFVDKMQGVSSDYHYLEIKSESTASTVEEILNCGLDGLLWCSPAEQDIPVIEELTRRRFPVAAVAPPHKSRFPLPAWNCVQPDFAQIGILRAGCVRNAGCRRAAYFGSEGPTFDAFCASLAPAERSYVLAHHCAVLDSGVSGIRAVLEDRPDCLVADGKIFSCLAELCRVAPELKQVTLLLDPVPYAFQFQKKYPDLKIRTPDYNWFKVLRKLGERAAVHLWKTIRSGEAFQSEILKVSAK